MEQTLGKRIVENRKRLKMTQDQLAEKLGVTAQAVSKWENDQSCPDISILPQLADIFGISIDALLGRNSATPAAYTQEESSEEEEEGAKRSWEFSFDTGRRGGFALALLVLAVGGQLLAARLLQRDLGLWSIIWTTALVVLGCFGLYPKFSFFRLGCLLFGSYTLLDNWQVLPITLGNEIVLPAILILLGLSLLADAWKKKGKSHLHFGQKGTENQSGKATKELTVDEDSFSFHASFADAQQSIYLPLLADGEVHVSFGNYEVDLSGIEAIAEDCTMEVNCSFGDLTLLIPRRFAVQPQGSSAFADVSLCGHPDPQPEGVITLDAHVSFGGITIRYI